MRIAITGHTAGIGRRFMERFPDTIGFSRTNGYDITNHLDRQRIVDESGDCGVFINNAAAGYGQTELLLELFKRWRDQDKIIVNVGSRIAQPGVNLHNHTNLLSYQSQKVILKEMSERLSKFESSCRVKYTWFGYVGTEYILKKYPHFTTADYITEDQSVDIIAQEFM